MSSPLPLDDVLADAEPLLDDHDPLQAELWCSDLLGAFWLRGADDGTVRDALAEVLLPYLEKAASPGAGLLCHALAALGHDSAAEVAERMTAAGVAAPAWAARPPATATDCYRLGDDFGDQDTLICGFDRDGAGHAVIVLVDHGLGGIAKDAFVVDDVAAALADLREQCEQEPFTSLVPLDPARARARLERAFARTDALLAPDTARSLDEDLDEDLDEHGIEDPDDGLDDGLDEDQDDGLEEISEDLPAARAFALARVRLLPSAGQAAAAAPVDVDTLVADFAASTGAGALPDPQWAGRLVGVWVDHVAGTGDDPRRISPARIEDLLLDITPGAVLLDAAGVRAVPAVAEAWLDWALTATTLSPQAVAHVREALADVLAEFASGYLDLQAVMYRHRNPETVDLRG